MLLGDKNSKHFQTIATIKTSNYNERSRINIEIDPSNKMILHVIPSDFPRISKKDAETSFHQVVPLSKDIAEDDNNGLPGMLRMKNPPSRKLDQPSKNSGPRQYACEFQKNIDGISFGRTFVYD